MIDVQYIRVPGGAPKRLGFFLDSARAKAIEEAQLLQEQLRKGGKGAGRPAPQAVVYVDGTAIDKIGGAPSVS